MEIEYYEQLYRQLIEHFYQQFDYFITKEWGGIADQNEMNDAVRQKAYDTFYAKVKKARIANRQTIRKWFGMGGQIMPNRQQIFKIALSVGLSRDDTNRYLQYGISETAFQENDYREFIVMYCLDHGIGLQKCEEMISFYESKCHNRGQWEQNTHTDWLRRQYEIVKLYKEQDFLLWMYKHQKYFKGYSLTVLHCYQKLMTKCLRIFRENMRQSLVVLLKEVGFFSWVAKKQGEQKYDENDIERFVKNRLRSSSHALDSNKAKEIRNLVSIVYASHDRICDLIQGVYTKMPAWRQGGTQRRVYHTLRNHMQRIDEKYLSELLNMALHKERQMRLQMLLAQEDNEQKRNELQKQLRKNKGRLHMIQRSDLLILAQYIIYAKYENNSYVSCDYRPAREEFRVYADSIMELCGMRKLDDSYMLDYVMLSCFSEEEIYLFSEIIEGVE